MSTVAAYLPQPRTSRLVAKPRPARLRSTSTPVLMIANGNASGIAGRREIVDGAAGLLRAQGSRVDVRVTSTLDELAEVVRGEERRLALLGGDGSLHAVANIPGPKPELALLPAGGANNVARALGIPADLRAASELAAAGDVRPLDAIAARTATHRHLAVEGVSVGYHALARAGYHGVNSADVTAGIAAGVGALARFRPVNIAIEADGALEFLRLSQLFVANLPLFGPGLRVAPDADATDGLLDLVQIETPGRLGLVSMLAHLRRGKHVGRPGVRTWRAERIRIATGGRSPIIADTTNLGSGTVELEVVPAALSVVAPRS